MHKWIKSMALAVCSGLVSMGALASPTYRYTFTTHETRCIDLDGIKNCADSFDHRPMLDRMSFQLTQAGEAAGGGSVDIVGAWDLDLDPAFHLQGLASLNLPSYGRDSVIPLDRALWEDWWFGNDTFVLWGEFSGGAQPGASFYLNDGNDEVTMGNWLGFSLYSSNYEHLDPSWLLQGNSPFEVAGLIIGDSSHPTFFSFTGRWHFAGVVSEPDTSALLLLAMGMAGLITRRRAKPAA